MTYLRLRLRWLVEVYHHSRSFWVEMVAEHQRYMQDEYDRLHPVYGPKTKMQAYMEGIWATEIMAQCLPVLRFEQFNRGISK